MRFNFFRFAVLACVAGALSSSQAQISPPRMIGGGAPPDQPAAQQQQQQPVNPANPAAQGARPPQGAPPPRLSSTQPFQLDGVSLTGMIDIVAKDLKFNYILDPRVNGKVTVYTYGEVKAVDLMSLLETMLRVNGATIVKVGDFYRIIPISSLAQMPLAPQVNADQKTLPDDDRMILNLIFLKYTTAAEMDKLLSPFYGEGATH
jgi:general secretion pathway protein D